MPTMILKYCYIQVWSQIRRAQIANQDGKMHNSQISKELGIEWRKMSAEQKAPFIQKVCLFYKRRI